MEKVLFKTRRLWRLLRQLSLSLVAGGICLLLAFSVGRTLTPVGIAFALVASVLAIGTLTNEVRYALQQEQLRVDALRGSSTDDAHQIAQERAVLRGREIATRNRRQ